MRSRRAKGIGNFAPRHGCHDDIAAPPLVSDLRQCAILLDIDGTILDIAPSPRQVWVPTGLRRTLARLADLTGGAVALVSGRSHQ